LSADLKEVMELVCKNPGKELLVPVMNTKEANEVGVESWYAYRMGAGEGRRV
jgi:hypothetical protein